MINRTLIRLKIVQLIYSFYQNGGKNVDTAEKELLFSLSKAYELYNYLLLLIIAVTRYAEELVEQKEAALKRKLEAVEAHTEMLKANMELIGRYVKPKGNA